MEMFLCNRPNLLDVALFRFPASGFFGWISTRCCEEQVNTVLIIINAYLRGLPMV